MFDSKYVLNGAPIIIDSDLIISAGALEYNDDQFQTLKEEHRNHHIIYRDGPSDRILTIPLTAIFAEV
jgi:hypothetical protein